MLAKRSISSGFVTTVAAYSLLLLMFTSLLLLEFQCNLGIERVDVVEPGVLNLDSDLNRTEKYCRLLLFIL